MARRKKGSQMMTMSSHSLTDLGTRSNVGVPVRVKICGLRRKKDVASAICCGASYLGFVFWPSSSRCISPDSAARLSRLISPEIVKVALFVDPSDAEIEDVLDIAPMDMLQLHGSETPHRVRQIRRQWGLPVMKAVGIGSDRDLEQVALYQGCTDQLLVDAKPIKGLAKPGGNGVCFDWNILSDFHWQIPWMLAGGLNSTNVADAMRLTGASQVDVSSGVESAPGCKDVSKMSCFVHAAKGI